MIPRLYQIRGAEWLASRKHAYLADGMRVGKTLQVLVAAKKVGAERMLVIGPAAARTVWPAAHAAYPNSNLHIEFRSYNEWAMKPDLRALVMAWQPQIVVFDEGHYLKNRKAARTKACLGTPLEPSPITRASHVWALSGTPMPNDASELYTIFKRFWPERLKQLGISTFGHWLNTFCVFWEGQWGTQVSGIKNEALLHKLLFEEGRMLRRTFLDVAPDVPPMVWGTDLVSAEDAKIPRELLIDRATIETWTTAGEMPDELQYASERRALGHYKAEYAVQEITEMLADGAMQKIVVFGWHKDVLNILETGLRRFGVVRWDGSTAGKDRPGILAAFHGDRARVFIGQIEACGTAIDLSAADHAYFAELAFSPGMNQQAAERVRAITKLVPCAVTVLQVQDTYDEAHAQIIVRKSNMQKAVDLHGV